MSVSIRGKCIEFDTVFTEYTWSVYMSSRIESQYPVASQNGLEDNQNDWENLPACLKCEAGKIQAVGVTKLSHTNDKIITIT